MKRYLAIKKITASVEKKVIPYFKGRKIEDIGKDEIREFIRFLQKEGLSTHTVNNHVSRLQGAFRDAEINWPKVGTLKHTLGAHQIVTYEEYRTLLDGTNWHNLKFAITTSYWTGARRAEIAHIKRGDIDLKRKLMMITQPKGGQEFRLVPMNRDIELALAGVEKLPIGDFGKCWCKHRHILPRVIKFHDFRRTAITNMLENGFTEKEAMEISGHKSRWVFEHYHIVRKQRLQEMSTRFFENMSVGSDKVSDSNRQDK